jgi:hypothetical protein
MRYVIIDIDYNDILEVVDADSLAQAMIIANRKYPTQLVAVEEAVTQ